MTRVTVINYAIGVAAIVLLIVWWVVLVNITAIEPVDWPTGVQATPIVEVP